MVLVADWSPMRNPSCAAPAFGTPTRLLNWSCMSPVSPPTVHVPVMMREVLRALDLRPGLVVVDGTLGGGGHAAKILEQIGPSGRLIGLDRDPTALERARPRLSGDNVTLVSASYVDLPQVLPTLALSTVDRILVDLGLSSDQLADHGRGFSFLAEGPLDLRFDATQGIPAAQLVATASEDELTKIFSDYGEDPAAHKLAAAIVKRRAQQPILSARQLADLVEQTLGDPGSREKHPATRIFQALRIAVNRELDHVQQALSTAFPQSLTPGGLLAVITFHSLEDRLVKEAFRHEDAWEVLTPRPIAPTPAEERFNPRCRSAKLRVARRAVSTTS